MSEEVAGARFAVEGVFAHCGVQNTSVFEV